MIFYKTNQNWLGDVRHLTTSWTMVRILRTAVAAGVYTALVGALIHWLDLHDDL